MGVHIFAGGSFNLSLEIDIYGIMCMGFDLAVLLHEWVYGFYKWWLSKVCYSGNLGVLGF